MLLVLLATASASCSGRRESCSSASAAPRRSSAQRRLERLVELVGEALVAPEVLVLFLLGEVVGRGLGAEAWISVGGSTGASFGSAASTATISSSEGLGASAGRVLVPISASTSKNSVGCSAIAWRSSVEWPGVAAARRSASCSAAGGSSATGALLAGASGPRRRGRGLRPSDSSARLCGLALRRLLQVGDVDPAAAGILGVAASRPRASP